MGKWILRLIGVLVLGFGGGVVYDYFATGLHTRPEMPPGAFSLSFEDSRRVIMLDTPDERFIRNYIMKPRTDVPDYFKDSWSYCKPPTDEERTILEEALNPGPGMRLDGVCSLDADGEIIPTGLVFSVPDI
ncbi:hypothetical protein [Ruegeria sp. HKCCC2117]|uniref:hypothetical protein n=1 Tax=Ruegeria sp. HKCCC2117 TaxID=2682992 RepID=UPI001489341B|nr:hypothetical protein [Ruegeria sp. HKCCC2117]